VNLDKHFVVTGRVRIRTVTESVEDVAHAMVEEQSIEIRRVPVGQAIETPPSVRTEGNVTIIPVLEEVLTVEKRLFLREEIHINRNRHSESIEVPGTRRKQTAVVDRLPELKEK